MHIFELNKLKIIFNRNIFHLKYFSDAKVGVDTAEEIYKIVLENINSDEKYGILTEFGKDMTMSRDARDFFGSRNVENIICNAVVVKNNYQKSLGDLYLFFSKPVIKTKLFKTEQEAVKWIRANIDA